MAGGATRKEKGKNKVKRTAPDPSSSISAPITVHRARSKRKWAKDDPSIQNSLHALEETWKAFKSDVDTALSSLRQPALSAISTAVSAPPPHGNLVAVCVLMRSGAVGGDRDAIFSGVVNHLERDADVVRIRAGSNPGMSALRDDLLARAQTRRTVLALDDVDGCAREVVRDIVYVCAAVAADKPQVSLVVGCSTSAEPLHAALGAHEAASVAVVVVEMPRARLVFAHVVESVLSKQTSGVLLSRAVYDLLQREFFERDSTLSMLLRTLRLVYTLHFTQQTLASVAARPPRGAVSLVGDEGCDTTLSDEMCEQLRSRTMSVLECGKGEAGNEEMRELAASWMGDISKVRRRSRTVQKLVWEVLVCTDAFKSDVEFRVGCKKDLLRVQIFRAFLPSADASAGVQPVVCVVREEISRAQRHQLLCYIKVMREVVAVHEEDEEMARLTTALGEHEETLREVPTAGAASGAAPSAGAASTPLAKGGAAAMGRRRAQLLGSAMKATPAQEKVGKVRKAVVALFDALLELVTPVEQLPMHEGIYFSRVADLIKITGGIGGPAEPRHTVLSAMRDPSKYVGSLDEAQVPDIAVAYQALSEGGRLVNLYDWYNTFSAIRMAQTTAKENGEADVNKEVLLQARFARACSELEFLGLFKHTKRKTDHVQRLVFE